jgi:hypothetical protein
MVLIFSNIIKLINNNFLENRYFKLLLKEYFNMINYVFKLVSLMVKNMCFLLKGNKFKSIKNSSQISCPTKNEISYTNLMFNSRTPLLTIFYFHNIKIPQTI